MAGPEGSPSNPLRLDLFQTVREVGWNTGASVRFETAFVIGFEEEFTSRMSWGFRTPGGLYLECGHEDGVVWGDGHIFEFPDIQKAMAEQSPPLTGDNVDIYLHGDPWPAEGLAWRWRSIKKGVVQHSTFFENILTPLREHPARLDLNTLEWTYPAP